jgi:MoxR-like ATPase
MSNQSPAELFSQYLARSQAYIIGADLFFERALIALLSGGHMLLVGPPGVAKTRSARVFGALVGLSSKRVQFTSDLLPSDVVGAEIYNPKTLSFESKKWPIFTEILIADELNRAPAKVQSAMLEAMAEGQVTLAGISQALPQPFMVMATMNPFDGVGTYTLPVASFDRFALSYEFDYPSIESEVAILSITHSDLPSEVLLNARDIVALQKLSEQIYVDERIYHYIARLLANLRSQEYLESGVSSRAGIALARAAQSRALLHGRTFVNPEDIQSLWNSVLLHRTTVSYAGVSAGVHAQDLLTHTLASTNIEHANETSDRV